MESYSSPKLVWAKVHGYPWWPALIPLTQKINEEDPILVNFIGHKSHSYLTKEKIRNFEEFYSEGSKTKNPSLLRAISLADEIKKGSSISEDLMQKSLFKIAKNPLSSKKRKKIHKKISVKLSKSNQPSSQVDSLSDGDSLVLQEISSTNPFQRISRSLIKELKIKTSIAITASDLKKEKIRIQKSKIKRKMAILAQKTKAKSIKFAKEENVAISTEPQTPVKNPEIEENLAPNEAKPILSFEAPALNAFVSSAKECNKLQNTKELYEKSLENSLVKLLSRSSKSVISLVSRLLNKYHDFDFSGPELFHNKIAKILKAMQGILINSGNEHSQMARVQLESVMSDIKEKVLEEMFNNQKYLEKLTFPSKFEPTLNPPVGQIFNHSAPIQKEISPNIPVIEETVVKLISDTDQNSTQNQIKKPTSSTIFTQNPSKTKTLLVVSKKKEQAKKIAIKKPGLRKKICLKMAKVLNECYQAEKECSQGLSLSIEGKIRGEYPLMDKEYKTYVKMIFYVLKRKKLNIDQLKDLFSLDFKHIEELNNFEFVSTAIPLRNDE